jgi:hypothetical protein
MTTLQRVQVLLDSKQRQMLRKIARREKRSMSAVLREIIDRGFAQLEADKQQWKRALSQLQELREASQIVYEGNPIREARAERERQVEEIWHRSS